jgi:hypothetical protein
VWGDLRQKLDVEREQLHLLLETHQSLLQKAAIDVPTVDELPALAAILYAFYSGIERLFRRIAVEFDGETPRGSFWHTELLERMTSSRAGRPPVISGDLGEELQEYLDFRHVFRHAYSFELRWSKMSPLVHRMNDVLRELDSEIDTFLKSVERKGDQP